MWCRFRPMRTAMWLAASAAHAVEAVAVGVGVDVVDRGQETLTRRMAVRRAHSAIRVPRSQAAADHRRMARTTTKAKRRKAATRLRARSVMSLMAHPSPVRLPSTRRHRVNRVNPGSHKRSATRSLPGKRVLIANRVNPVSPTTPRANRRVKAGSRLSRRASHSRGGNLRMRLASRGKVANLRTRPASHGKAVSLRMRQGSHDRATRLRIRQASHDRATNLRMRQASHDRVATLPIR